MIFEAAMKCVILLVLSICLTVSARHYRFRVQVTQIPCTPSHAEDRGEDPVLLSEESTPLTEAEGFGPNVCRVTRNYTVETFAYRWTRRYHCWGHRCFYSYYGQYCAKTSTYTNYITKREIDCCDGFAVDPADTASSSSSHSHYRHNKGHHSSSRTDTLRDSGCSLALVDSVTECLLELDLLAFINQFLSEAPDQTIDELGNGDSQNSFTVFAAVSGSPTGAVLAHIVEGTVEGKQLRHGEVLETLMSDVWLHVGKNESVFINGVNVTQLNACRARNGIVHVVNSTIPHSDRTIVETLKENPQFSTFLRLLDGADITPLLNVSKGKSRTLLAPTNDAFDKLPENAVQCLLTSENKNLLEQLVLIHIGSPAEYTATLSLRSRFYTFNTRYYLFVREEGGNVLVTSDQIPLQDVDIPANNGVIHSLPQVVVPPEVDFDKMNCPEVSVSTTEAPPTSGTLSVPEVLGDISNRSTP